MRYRIVPDRDDVAKLNAGQRGRIWGLALPYRDDVVAAADEADRLERIWKVRWHVLAEDEEDVRSWAKTLRNYRENGIFARGKERE